jgi:vacuolar-type H+-ATPase subunit I/STV1
MKKAIKFAIFMIVYFGIFHGLFNPLLEGNIKGFFINGALPIFIIIFLSILIVLSQKLGYDDLIKPDK